MAKEANDVWVSTFAMNADLALQRALLPTAVAVQDNGHAQSGLVVARFCLLTCLKIGISGVSPALGITRLLLAAKCPRILSLDVFDDKAVSFPRDLIEVTLDAWRKSKYHV